MKRIKVVLEWEAWVNYREVVEMAEDDYNKYNGVYEEAGDMGIPIDEYEILNKEIMGKYKPINSTPVKESDGTLQLQFFKEEDESRIKFLQQKALTEARERGKRERQLIKEN